jgi:hypothetical protein
MPLQVTACTQTQFNIRSLHETFYQQEKIRFNTEYQRTEVWKIAKKQMLIDSILRGFDISKIFLRQQMDGNFECLDGQQRLKAIFGYLEDVFPLSTKETPEMRPLRFSQLDDELKWRIWSYTIYATVVHNIDDSTTCKIFLRLQEGMPLNSAEKLNAMFGPVRDAVYDLANHRFFTLSGLSDHRFSRRYEAAQVLLIETSNSIPNIKFPNLRVMYKSPLNHHKVDSVKRVLNFLANEFSTEASIIRNSADFVTLYMLTSDLLKGYSLTAYKGALKQFFQNFLVRVGEMRVAPQTTDGIAYWNYKTYRKTSADSKTSLDGRLAIVMSLFLRSYPNLPQKDPNRDFDYWQKLAIYDRAGGICEGSCTSRIKIRMEDGQYHHIRHWADGGPTIVENGRFLCIPCHQAAHSSCPEE